MRKRKMDDSCPICIGRSHRSPEEHAEQCLRKVLNKHFFTPVT